MPSWKERLLSRLLVLARTLDRIGIDTTSAGIGIHMLEHSSR